MGNRSFGKIPYKVKLMLVLSLCVAVPYILLSIGLLHTVQKNIDKQFTEEKSLVTQSGLNQIQFTLDQLYWKIAFITKYNTLNQILIKESRMNLLETLNLTEQINQVFQALFPVAESSAVRVYTTNPHLYDTEYVRKTTAEEKKRFDALAEDGAVQSLQTAGGKASLVVYKKYSLFNEYYNVISITVPLTELGKSFKGLHPDKNFAVYFHNDGQYAPLTAYKDAGPVFEAFRRGERLAGFQAEEHVSSGLNGRIYLFFDKSGRDRKMVQYLLLDTLLLLAILAGIILMINFISSKLTQKLTGIIADIRPGAGGGPQRDSHDEFDIINNKLNELMDAVKKEHEKLLKLEIETLQQKISPHFLYNILSAVKWSLADEAKGEIIDVLAGYYRNSFHKSASFVSLSYEMEGLEKYVKLLMFSYNKSFSYEACVPPEAGRVQIPSNILQPLVENAFLYGANCKASGEGRICVRAAAAEGVLEIQITNNGSKTPAETINGLLAQDSGKSCAIRAINKRLRLSYGGEYGLHYQRSGEDMTARLVLPAREEAQ